MVYFILYHMSNYFLIKNLCSVLYQSLIMLLSLSFSTDRSSASEFKRIASVILIASWGWLHWTVVNESTAILKATKISAKSRSNFGSAIFFPTRSNAAQLCKNSCSIMRLSIWRIKTCPKIRQCMLLNCDTLWWYNVLNLAQIVDLIVLTNMSCCNYFPVGRLMDTWFTDLQ